VLEAQDAIETDLELIVTRDTLQTEECSSASAECPSSPTIAVPTDKVERTEAGAAVIPIDSTIPSDTVTSPSLSSITPSTPTAIADQSQSKVELPLEAASTVAQEEEQKQPETLKESVSEAAVTTDAADNAGVDSDDKISSTAEESKEGTSDSNNIEDVGEDNKGDDDKTLTLMIQKLLELVIVPMTKMVTKKMATMEKKMTLPMTQREMNLQNLTIQVARMMIITLNLTAMAQTNRMTQMARMTLPEKELCDNSRI
jgi:hypothetical protein